MTKLLCPHCGALMRDFSELDIRAYTRLERRIIEALIQSGERHLSKRELVEQIYFDDPNGGPDWAESSISVRMVELRRKLAKNGWTIETRHGVGYQLRKAADVEQAGAQ